MALGILRQRLQSRSSRRSLFLEALEARNLMASFTTLEDTPLVVTAPAPLIGQVAAKPLHGELTVFATGGFSYAPAANYFGPDRFTYLPISSTPTPTPAAELVEVTLEVTPVNDAPVANDDRFSTKSGAALSIARGAVLENDRDVDSNALSVLLQVGSGPSHGTLTTSATGVLVYKPNANFVGQDSFLYFASDGQAVSERPAKVTINVEAISHPVEARNDSFEVRQDTTLVVDAPGVLANDGSNTGPRLNAMLVAGVGEGNGSLTLAADGSVKYVPPTGFAGKVSFTYRAFVPDTTTPPTAANPGTVSNIATVTITVKPTPPPEARPDQYGMEQGGVLTVAAPGVLGNDGSLAGPRLYATVVAAPANGTLTLNLDGSFVYTPKPEFFGVETFTYRASDQAPTVANPGTAPSNSSIAKVYISVRPKAPVALPDKYEIDFGQRLEVAAPGVLGNDSSVNGAALTASVVEKPRGELKLNADGSFVYVPPVGFSGTDSFKYRASIAVTGADPAGTTPNTIGSIAIVTIFVRPGARDDQYLVFQGTPLAVKAPGVLANDGSTTNDRKLYAYPGRGPEHGTLVLNSDGSFVYTPEGDYTGSDTFTYRASVISPDSASPILEGSVATVHLQVVRRVDPLEARNDLFTMDIGGTLAVEKPGVLKNDGVPGQVLVATLVEKPGQGELTFNSDGSFKYVPAIDFAGEVKFTYRASTPATNTDPTTGPIVSNVATVTIKVGPIVSPPIAQNDRYEMRQGGELKVAAPGVLANDGQQLNLRLMATLETDPENGTLTLNADGSFLYLPKVGFAGVDTFKYRARPATTTPPGTDPNVPPTAADLTDPATGSIATVTIVVNPVNPVPRAQDDKFTTAAGQELVVGRPGVLRNDGITSANFSLVASLESEPGNGRVVLTANGGFTYMPAAGFTGIDSFTYRASVPTTASGAILPDNGSVATVYINVVKPNPFHNAQRPKDVNGDRKVSTIDAVLVINRMSNPVPFSMGEGEASSLPFYDVNGDGLVTTIDAVLVINELMSPQGPAEADEAEGESSAAAATNESLEATLSVLTCDAEELAARKKARAWL